MVLNRDDMDIAFLTASIYLYKHYTKPQMDEINKLGFDMDDAENIVKKAEYQFKKATTANYKLHSTEFIELGLKFGETFIKLPEKVLSHIINQSPLAALVPLTTLAMIMVNDALWEYKLNKEKKDS